MVMLFIYWSMNHMLQNVGFFLFLILGYNGSAYCEFLTSWTQKLHT